MNRGGRAFADVEQELPRVIVSDVLVADLNGDGALDIYLVSPRANAALIGDGTGAFVEATAELGLSDAGDSAMTRGASAGPGLRGARPGPSGVLAPWAAAWDPVSREGLPAPSNRDRTALGGRSATGGHGSSSASSGRGRASRAARLLAERLRATVRRRRPGS